MIFNFIKKLLGKSKETVEPTVTEVVAPVVAEPVTAPVVAEVAAPVVTETVAPAKKARKPRAPKSAA